MTDTGYLMPWFGGPIQASVEAGAPTLSGTPDAATQGTAYSWTPLISGGTAPFTYTVVAGSLPAGLTLNNSTGQISGTPTGTGTNSFTIRATDANSKTGDLATAITVAAAANPTVYTPANTTPGLPAQPTRIAA